MKRLSFLLTLLACLLQAASGLAQTKPSSSQGVPPLQAAPLQVMVSVSPLQYFTAKIAGPLAQVNVMVPKGADAHSYEPKPSQMAQVAAARLYLAQGVEFEHVWLPKLAKSNPRLVVVQTTAGIDLLPSEEHEPGKHGSAASDHDEKELDPHTWTSPVLAARQAANIAAAFSQADPANAAVYAANLKAFEAELAQLDAKIRQQLASVKPGAKFLTFHPAWAYFAKAYGLEEVSIEVNGKEPGPRKLGEIIAQAKKLGVTVVFVQPQFSRKSAQTVAEAIGARLVDADDLSDDWADNLVRVAAQIAQAAR